MTKGELYKIEQRVDEISKIIDVCSDSDIDVLDNLDKELEMYIDLLKQNNTLRLV